MASQRRDNYKAQFPGLAWAGVFGSVSRGDQRPDSDVNIIVGYAAGSIVGEVPLYTGVIREDLGEIGRAHV